MRWLDALILGLVQGVTEFLPISSDGHLSIVEKILAGFSGIPESGGGKLFFIVMLHLGTLAAIILHYRRTAVAGTRGLLLGSEEVDPDLRRGPVLKAGLLACLATLPAVPVGLFLKHDIEEAFDSLTAAGLGFLITAAALGVSMRMKGGHRGLKESTWLHALLIGTAQAVAILPGVSRSGMTITTALALGFTRSWAVGFSLLMAVPAILGATVLELKDLDTSTLTPDRVGPMILGVIAAGVVGYLAIVWLVRIVRAGRMWYFSVYLIGLAVVIFTWIALNGGSPDGPRTALAERPSFGQSASRGAPTL